ncbi:MAG: hypothetical protein QOI24_3000 [Acidobacteriota bacterium]|jgi:hypothetical protein|nr:hypothetical protein [Acidobacteriota bacterium]
MYARVTLATVLTCATLLPSSLAAAEAAPLGTWRGTSTCTDRVAAPACKDEIVVYELTAGAKTGIVHWKADKIVDGKRQTMGEMDLTYDADDACWKAEFKSPRSHSVWCLKVDGTHMTGTAWLLPGKQTVRKVDVRKD